MMHINRRSSLATLLRNHHGGTSAAYLVLTVCLGVGLWSSFCRLAEGFEQGIAGQSRANHRSRAIQLTSGHLAASVALDSLAVDSWNTDGATATNQGSEAPLDSSKTVVRRLSDRLFRRSEAPLPSKIDDEGWVYLNDLVIDRANRLLEALHTNHEQAIADRYWALLESIAGLSEEDEEGVNKELAKLARRMIRGIAESGYRSKTHKTFGDVLRDSLLVGADIRLSFALTAEIEMLSSAGGDQGGIRQHVRDDLSSLGHELLRTSYLTRGLHFFAQCQRMRAPDCHAALGRFAQTRGLNGGVLAFSEIGYELSKTPKDLTAAQRAREIVEAIEVFTPDTAYSKTVASLSELADTGTAPTPKTRWWHLNTNPWTRAMRRFLQEAGVDKANIKQYTIDENGVVHRSRL